MLDLSKAYGIYEGVVFYGDHQNENVIYYFPNEIKMAKRTGDNNKYELGLQLFYENKMVDASSNSSLDDTAGSYLRLSSICEITPARLEKAFSALRSNIKSISSDVRLTTPQWIDGKVYLITLGESSGDDVDTSDMVRTIISSQRPSLTSDLKAVFNVEYDKYGTELIYSTMKSGQGGQMAVVYDLQFAALQPTFDLKMTAYLERCKKTISTNIDADIEIPIKSVHLGLHTQLEWLTQKLMENGDIKIECANLGTTEEEKKAIDDIINDFQDKVLKEFFVPTTAIAVKPDSLDILSKVCPVKIGLNYKYTNRSVENERSLHIDYSTRTAVISHHTPQGILFDENNVIGDNLSDYTQKVVLGTQWKRKNIEVKFNYDFHKNESNLVCAECLMWRQKDGLKTDIPEPGIAIPDNCSPLANFVYTAKEHSEVHSVSWSNEEENDDADGYYYQLRLQYADNGNNSVSPREIITKPKLSRANILNIFPEIYTFYRRILVMSGTIDFNVFSKVEVVFDILDPDDVVLANRHILLTEETDQDSLEIRGKDERELKVMASKVFYFKDKNRAVLKYPPYRLIDYGVIVDDPLLTKQVFLDVLGTTEGVRRIRLSYTICSAVSQEYRKVIVLKNIEGQEINIEAYSNDDTISYEVIKTYKNENGKLINATIASENIRFDDLYDITIDLDNDLQ